MDRTYGIVFSGGGALGSWEIGCYRAVLSRYGGKPTFVTTGASAGAINAVGVCAGMPSKQMEDIWAGLRNDQVYVSQFGAASVALLLWRTVSKVSISQAVIEFAKKSNSIYSTTPFESTLKRVLSGYYQGFVQSNISCVISLTNLTKGAGEVY